MIGSLNVHRHHLAYFKLLFVVCVSRHTKPHDDDPFPSGLGYDQRQKVCGSCPTPPPYTVESPVKEDHSTRAQWPINITLDV